MWQYCLFLIFVILSFFTNVSCLVVYTKILKDKSSSMSDESKKFAPSFMFLCDAVHLPCLGLAQVWSVYKLRDKYRFGLWAQHGLLRIPSLAFSFCRKLYPSSVSLSVSGFSWVRTSVKVGTHGRTLNAKDTRACLFTSIARRQFSN